MSKIIGWIQPIASWVKPSRPAKYHAVREYNTPTGKKQYVLCSHASLIQQEVTDYPPAEAIVCKLCNSAVNPVARGEWRR